MAANHHHAIPWYGFFLAVLATGSPFGGMAQIEQVDRHFHALEASSKKSPQTIGFVQDSMGLVQDYGKLAQIILVRHGEPDLDKKGWRKRKAAKRFVRAYDSVPVVAPSFAPVALLPGELATIHTSNINRAISTAIQVFGQEDKQRPQALFREFERKILCFPNINLPLKGWLVASRVLWFLGLNDKGIEHFRGAKARAKQGAVFLEEDAMAHGKTLLVSHGLLNHFLVKYLEKKGWVEVYDGGKGYLSQKVLVRYQE